jgi:hypothetical protein
LIAGEHAAGCAVTAVPYMAWLGKWGQASYEMKIAVLWDALRVVW